MSEALITKLLRLIDESDWTAMIDLESTALMLESPADRARCLYMLSHARWNLGRDAFDYAQAIRLAHMTVKLDDLKGKSLHHLGRLLVTVGRFRDGRLILQRWIARFHEWPADVQAGLAHVQYTLGYAARYERDWRQAELWYSEALASFRSAGDETWISNVGCALSKVFVRTGRPTKARQLLDTACRTNETEGYRLSALAEVLAAEGHLQEAQSVGEQASEALINLIAGEPPWELVELHLFLATLKDQAGAIHDKDKHLALALEVMGMSPRHDLYTAACLLLDNDRQEVNAG